MTYFTLFSPCLSGCSSALLLALWNSPLAIRTIGSRPAYEWASNSIASVEQYQRADRPRGGNITLVGDVEISYFQNGVLFWVIGMLVNVLAVGMYMAFR